MYFANEQHKNNYMLLLSLYGSHVLNDGQYKAQIYIAAYPDIFELIDVNGLDRSSGPLFQLMKWNDQSEKHEFIAPGLTGSTTRLAEVGLSLYNGYPIGLDDVFGSIASLEMIEVFLQACKIRAIH